MNASDSVPGTRYELATCQRDSVWNKVESSKGITEKNDIAKESLCRCYVAEILFLLPIPKASLHASHQANRYASASKALSMAEFCMPSSGTCSSGSFYTWSYKNTFFFEIELKPRA